MKPKDTLRIVPAGKFLKLFKHDSQYTTPVIRINQQRKQLKFIITFKLEDQEDFYLLNRSSLGYSQTVQRIKTYTKSQLYPAMMSVPLRARETIQILQVPNDQKDLKSYVTHYQPEELLAIQNGYIPVPDGVYDPFRDAHSAVYSTDAEEFQVIQSQDYEGIQDFHPFLEQDDNVLAIPCLYQDPIRRTTVTIQLMGWYFLNQQLKISWKPENQKRARWRSSIVAIDKKTGRYFFQGNLYQQKGTDPIFIENLQFNFGENSPHHPIFQQAYRSFIKEIEQQKQRALLRTR